MLPPNSSSAIDFSASQACGTSEISNGLKPKHTQSLPKLHEKSNLDVPAKSCSTPSVSDCSNCNYSRDSNCNLKKSLCCALRSAWLPSHLGALPDAARCEGNGAHLLTGHRLRMNTNGYGRGDMTGSSATTTAATESASWGPTYITTTSRQRGPLPPPPPPGAPPHPVPPLPEQRSLILPAPAPPPTHDVPLFRPPLTPPSPSTTRIYPTPHATLPPPPHEQFPLTSTASSPSIYSPSPLYPTLYQHQQVVGSYPYPGGSSAAASLLSAREAAYDVSGYAQLLQHLQQHQRSGMSGQSSVHLQHAHPALGAHRTDSPGQRPHPLTSQQRSDRLSKSPEERTRDIPPFRHPALASPLRSAHVHRDTSGMIHPGHHLTRPLLSRLGQHEFRVPPLGYTVAEYASHLPEPLPKKPRLGGEGGGEGESPSTSFHRRSPSHSHLATSSVHKTQHSVTTTISTSATHVMTTSAQRSTTSPPLHPPGGATASISGSGSAALLAAASQPHYPPHFMRGSIIQLANGQLKRVEDLRTDDFVDSADISPDLKIDSSQVVHIEEKPASGTVVLGFSVGQQKLKVTVEATVEHPFFVFGQGWSSVSPEKTQQRYGLQCYKLRVGDICISLTQKQTSSGVSAQSVEAGQSPSGPSTSGSATGSGVNGSSQSHRTSQSRPPEEVSDPSLGTFTSQQQLEGGSQQGLATRPPPADSTGSSTGSSRRRASSEFGGGDTGGGAGAHLSGSHVDAADQSASTQYVSVDSPGSPPVFTIGDQQHDSSPPLRAGSRGSQQSEHSHRAGSHGGQRWADQGPVTDDPSTDVGRERINRQAEELSLLEQQHKPT